jgi:hypothetical protein
MLLVEVLMLTLTLVGVGVFIGWLLWGRKK